MYENYLAHYGVLGMKWGRRRDRYGQRQRPLSPMAAYAKYKNDKVDASFRKWKENDAKREEAIYKGKVRNLSKLDYVDNKKDKSLKKAYKQSNKEYKKSLRGNTTYRKGQIISEVSSDLSRQHLKRAKAIAKSKEFNQRKYNKEMSAYNKNRYKASKVTTKYANRSRTIASLKAYRTKAIKGIAISAAVAGGKYVIGKAADKRFGTNRTYSFQPNPEMVRKLRKAASVANRFL